MLLFYVGLLGLTALGMIRIPSGFVPIQDKGYLIADVQLPDSASLERTVEAVGKVEQIALETPGVAHVVSIPGQSFVLNANSSNYAGVFLPLKPFGQRKGAALSGEAILKRLRARLAREVPEARVLVFGAPAVRGLGNAGGFKLMVKATGDVDYGALQTAADNLAAKGNQQPGLVGLFDGFRARTPQLYLDVDREKVKTMGVPLNNVFDALQAYMGSYYVNDFNRFGRTFQVVAQADAPFRAQLDDVMPLKTRNANGEMVPLGSVINVSRSFGPDVVQRYNAYTSADINGGPAPGFSSGQAQAAMAKILDETLPRGMSYEWTDLAYQQLISGNTGLLVFPLCVLFVFLVLAAQYESLSLPLAIILIVPMCMLPAVTALKLDHGDNNIFTQIGLLVLVGLACKNAILIVEFAKHLQEDRGHDARSAVLEAAHLRLRPILMTSMAFIMGVVPLVLATGAGAEVRHALGVTVFAGMLGVTAFGLLLTPVFYVFVRRATAHAAAPAPLPPLAAPEIEA